MEEIRFSSGTITLLIDGRLCLLAEVAISCAYLYCTLLMRELACESVCQKKLSSWSFDFACWRLSVLLRK